MNWAIKLGRDYVFGVCMIIVTNSYRLRVKCLGIIFNNADAFTVSPLLDLKFPSLSQLFYFTNSYFLLGLYIRCLIFSTTTNNIVTACFTVEFSFVIWSFCVNELWQSESMYTCAWFYVGYDLLTSKPFNATTDQVITIHNKEVEALKISRQCTQNTHIPKTD